MKKKTWTKKGIKGTFTASREKRGKDRYLVISNPTYAAIFEYDSWQAAKRCGWRAK